MEKDKKIVKWERETTKDIMYKYVMPESLKLVYDDKVVISKGEVAIFTNEDQLADALEAGEHLMNNSNLPNLSEVRLRNKEKYFDANIYFLDINLSKNHVWGSSTPVTICDKNLNDVSVGVIGKYDYQISNYMLFVKRIAPKFDTFSRKDLAKYIKPRILTEFINAVNNIHLSIFDIEDYYVAIARIMEDKLDEIFSELGLRLSNLIIDEVHLPKFLKDALKKNNLDDLTSDSFNKSDFDPSLGLNHDDADESGLKNFRNTNTDVVIETLTDKEKVDEKVSEPSNDINEVSLDEISISIEEEITKKPVNLAVNGEPSEFVLTDLADNSEINRDKINRKYEQFDFYEEREDAIKKYKSRLIDNNESNKEDNNIKKATHSGVEEFQLNNFESDNDFEEDLLKEFTISLDPLKEDNSKIEIVKDISLDEVNKSLSEEEDLKLLDISEDDSSFDFAKLDELKFDLDSELDKLRTSNEFKMSKLDEEESKSFKSNYDIDENLYNIEPPESEKKYNSSPDTVNQHDSEVVIDENLYSIEPPESEKNIDDSIKQLKVKNKNLNVFVEEAVDNNNVDEELDLTSLSKPVDTTESNNNENRPYISLVEERQKNNSSRLLDASLTSAFIVQRKREEEKRSTIENNDKKLIEELKNKTSQSEDVTNGAYNPGVKSYEYDFSKRPSSSRADQRNKLRSQMMSKLGGSSSTTNAFVHSANKVESREVSSFTRSTSKSTERMCPHCARLIPDSSTYCRFCGESTKVTKKICPSCRNHVSDNAAFCSLCGTKISSNF